MNFLYMFKPKGGLSIFKESIKWICFSLVIGIWVGIATAMLMVALHWATDTRESHQTLIWFLPVAGLAVGLLYHHFGSSVAKGNNQLLEELDRPKHIIPFKMAPFIFVGTVVSHLFGASVGREGTAVQIGGAIADQFSRFFKKDRSIFILMGISSGFAGLFGTPLAGTVFALEVLKTGKVNYKAMMPCLLVAVISDFTSRQVTHWFHIPHTHYEMGTVPDLNISFFFWAVLAGVVFGICSTFFAKFVTFFGQFAQYIQYPPLRSVFAGLIVAVLVYCIGTKYIGLGIPTIVAAFETVMPSYDFMVKLLLTTFCIAFGFKGGEVTPLFFIGATLGSALSLIIPLPVGLLAGMGFVAVFAGATNTPMACILMGIELFGSEGLVYISIACIIAYLFSGHTGIYGSQFIGISKSTERVKDENKTLSRIN